MSYESKLISSKTTTTTKAPFYDFYFNNFYNNYKTFFEELKVEGSKISLKNSDFFKKIGYTDLSDLYEIIELTGDEKILSHTGKNISEKIYNYFNDGFCEYFPEVCNTNFGKKYFEEGRKEKEEVKEVKRLIWEGKYEEAKKIVEKHKQYEKEYKKAQKEEKCNYLICIFGEKNVKANSEFLYNFFERICKEKDGRFNIIDIAHYQGILKTIEKYSGITFGIKDNTIKSNNFHYKQGVKWAEKNISWLGQKQQEQQKEQEQEQFEEVKKQTTTSIESSKGQRQRTNISQQSSTAKSSFANKFTQKSQNGGLSYN